MDEGFTDVMVYEFEEGEEDCLHVTYSAYCLGPNEATFILVLDCCFFFLYFCSLF